MVIGWRNYVMQVYSLKEEQKKMFLILTLGNIIILLWMMKSEMKKKLIQISTKIFFQEYTFKNSGKNYSCIDFKEILLINAWLMHKKTFLCVFVYLCMAGFILLPLTWRLLPLRLYTTNTDNKWSTFLTIFELGEVNILKKT